jgi:hypothetical protein
MDTASLDVGGSIEGKGDGARWGEVMFMLFKGNRYHDRIGAGSGLSAFED